MKEKLSKTLRSSIILDSMPGIAYIFSKEGYMLDWNMRTEEILEYSAKELEGRYFLNFIEETYWQSVKSAFENTFLDGYAQIEYEIITKSGKRIHYLGTGAQIWIDGVDYLMGLAQDISELNSARNKIKSQIEEINRLNERLMAENIYLKNQIYSSNETNDIIGASELLKYILFKIKQVAPTDASVLIEGETGTGKELVARAIHKNSSRCKKSFIKVNCASIPENLIESELFGHEKGAFTSAVERRIGRFEIANGGTIFLDEIGELPLSVQPKLLNVLQYGEFERLGSSKTIKTDVRVIAATNKTLENEIKKGSFRSDLFYRINVFPISVSPLRERKDDIPILVNHFINIYSRKLNKPISPISKSTLNRLIEYPYPGNIRELENIIERGIILSHNNILNLDFLNIPQKNFIESSSLAEVEKNHILKILEKTNWKISGSGGAAEMLNINSQTLRSRMLKLGIKRGINTR